MRRSSPQQGFSNLDLRRKPSQKQVVNGSQPLGKDGDIDNDASLVVKGKAHSNDVLGNISNDGLGSSSSITSLQSSLSGSQRNLSKSETALMRTQPIVVPHGFQMVKCVDFVKESINSGLYIPSSTSMQRNETFLMTDAKNVYVYQGDKKIGTLSKDDRTRSIPPSSSRSSNHVASHVKTAMAGLKAWTCINIWKPAVVVIATTHLEIKVCIVFYLLSKILHPTLRTVDTGFRLEREVCSAYDLPSIDNGIY